MNPFRDLHVYQKALELGADVRVVTRSFPRTEMFVLASQFQRAVDSVALNIAEGAGSDSRRDYSRFLNYSIRSAFECLGCLDIARRNEYVTVEQHRDMDYRTNEIIAMLFSLKRSKMSGT